MIRQLVYLLNQKWKSGRMLHFVLMRSAFCRAVRNPSKTSRPCDRSHPRHPSHPSHLSYLSHPSHHSNHSHPSHCTHPCHPSHPSPPTRPSHSYHPRVIKSQSSSDPWFLKSLKQSWILLFGCIIACSKVSYSVRHSVEYPVDQCGKIWIAYLH